MGEIIKQFINKGIPLRRLRCTVNIFEIYLPQPCITSTCKNEVLEYPSTEYNLKLITNYKNEVAWEQIKL